MDCNSFSGSRDLFPRPIDHSMNRHCQRSKAFEPKTKHVMNFLMLREAGECVKKAIAYSAKRFCRYDSTQLRDGTGGFRILKRKKVEGKYVSGGWATNGQPAMENQLPDIQGILANQQEQNRLIKTLMGTVLDRNQL